MKHKLIALAPLVSGLNLLFCAGFACIPTFQDLGDGHHMMAVFGIVIVVMFALLACYCFKESFRLFKS